MKDFDKHCMDYPKVYMEIKKKEETGYIRLCAIYKKQHSVIESNRSLGWARFHWVTTVCIWGSK